MNWWVWVIVGIVLLLAEVLTPGGFYLLFVGLAAIIIGAATAFGLQYDLWYQVFLFAALSVLLLSLARRPLVARLSLTSADRAAVDDVVGEVAVAKERLAPGQNGQVELRGTVWSARNCAATTILPGERSRVMSVEGLTLVVGPEAAGSQGVKQ